MGYICYDVRCPNCAESFYETTEFYDPNKMTTGAMLRFKKKYGPEGYNWSLPFSDHDMSEGIVCPECGGPLAPSGKIKVEPIVGIDSWGVTIDISPLEEQEVPVKEITGTEILALQEKAAKIPKQELLQRISNPELTGLEGGPEDNDDPVAKALTQEHCTICGHFFSVDAWTDHLKVHPDQGEINLQPEPIVTGRLKEKKEKGLKGLAKLQTKLIPETDDQPGVHCPLCEAMFGQDQKADYEAHIKTHDLGSVTQAVAQ